MFLRSLTVRKGDVDVRRITFRSGLNLVVDTTTDVPTDSGNSVGKTTLLRTIDFCLGSDGKNIYEDAEFKQVRNESIYQFLHQPDVSFELVLGDSQRTLTIVRSFDGHLSIDGEVLPKIGAFKERLGRELFGLKGKKPSFRELISKFVRISPYQISNTVFYLHAATSREEYETIYLYLFGFRDQSLLDRRKTLLSQLKKQKKRQVALTSLFSRPALRQILTVLERDIAALRLKIESFQVSGAVMNEISSLENVRADIARLSTELSQSSLRLHINRDAISRLMQTTSEIDVPTIETLYRQASIELPNLAKKFSDVLTFHNKMIVNKIRFIQQTMEQVQQKVTDLKTHLTKLLDEERVLLMRLSKKGALIDLQKLHRELEELTAQKASKEALSTELDQVSKTLEKTKVDLDGVNTAVLAHQNDLEKRISEFNLIFSDFSNRLYGEEYVLSFDLLEDKGPRLFDIKIVNTRANEGTGKKRAQISAFDLAYLEFLARQHAKFVRFTLHDRVEDVAINQLKTLFDIADGIEGQYVVAVLRDKVESLGAEWLDGRTILNLSQGDKFFRLP